MPPFLDTPFVNTPIPEYHWHFLLTSPHPPSYSMGTAFFIFFNLQPSSHTNHKYQLVCCYTLTFWGWRHCCEGFFVFVVCLQFVFFAEITKKTNVTNTSFMIKIDDEQQSSHLCHCHYIKQISIRKMTSQPDVLFQQQFSDRDNLYSS